jgi:hypothetical protein
VAGVDLDHSNQLARVLYPDGRPGPKLLLQQVPEAKTVKNRMHLDIDATDIEAEAVRLEALGARRVADEQIHEHRTNWILMANPEGNEFCVGDGGIIIIITTTSGGGGE